MTTRVALLVGLLTLVVGLDGCGSKGRTTLQGRIGASCRTLKSHLGQALELAEESLAHPGLGDDTPSWRFDGTRASGARPEIGCPQVSEGSGQGSAPTASDDRHGGSVGPPQATRPPWELESRALNRPLAMTIRLCIDARALPVLVRRRLEEALMSAMWAFTHYTLGEVGRAELVHPLETLVQLLDEVEQYPLIR